MMNKQRDLYKYMTRWSAVIDATWVVAVHWLVSDSLSERKWHLSWDLNGEKDLEIEYSGHGEQASCVGGRKQKPLCLTHSKQWEERCRMRWKGSVRRGSESQVADLGLISLYERKPPEHFGQSSDMAWVTGIEQAGASGQYELQGQLIRPRSKIYDTYRGDAKSRWGTEADLTTVEAVKIERCFQMFRG